MSIYDTHEVGGRSKDEIRKGLERKVNDYAQEHKGLLSSGENLRAEGLYKAGCQILDQYEIEMKDSNIFNNLSTVNYVPMRQLKEKYDKSYEDVVKLGILPNFDTKINEMIEEIDIAENKALEGLKLGGERFLEGSWKNRIEKKLGKKIGELNEKEGIYFTSGANGVSSTELKSMFETWKGDLIYESKITGKEVMQTDIVHDNSQKTLILDYSHCTNNELKQEIINMYGTTYLEVKLEEDDLRINGIYKNQLQLWEGVTLHEKVSRSIFMKNDELKELKEMKHRLTSGLNISDYTKNPELDENLKQYTKIIPEDLRDELKGKGSTNDYMNYNKFLDETDKRLSELIIEANARGLIFKEPPMKENLELNLRDDGNEFKRLMWGENNKNILGNGLYNIIKDNDEDYADYINDLIKIKQPIIEQETSKNIALKRYEMNADSPENGKDKLTEEEKERMQLGLNILKEYIGVCRTKKDSEELSTILDTINEEEERLRFVNPLSKKAIQERTINKILMNFFNEGSISRESTKNIVTKRMNDLFYGNKEEQLEAIIGINSQNGFRRGTKSDVEEIIKRAIESLDTTSDNKDEWGGLGGLHLRDRDREKMRENIWKLLSITPDGFETDENGGFITEGDKIVVKKEYKQQQELIDKLYEIAETKDAEDIAKFLAENGILPKEWEGWKDIQETCSEIKKALNENSKSAIEIKEKDIEKIYKDRKKELEKKRANLTNEFSEEEQAELDGINLILENKNSTINQIQNELIHQQNYIKYCGGASSIVNSALLHHLAGQGEYGRGIVDKYGYSTTVTKYYQDIYGINTFHISTRAQETITTIAREIAITVAVCCLTGGAGSAIISGALRGAATAARAARAIKLANTIQKGIKIGTEGINAVDGVGSATYRLLQKAAMYGLEGPIFNTASNIVHGDWESININPFARENIQTSMFLASLGLANAIVSGIGKVGGKIIETVGNKSKLMLKGINWTKSMPNTIRTMKGGAELITEAGTMMASESFCNIIFGHEVRDPDTGEKLDKAFDWPDEASWTQMMGIIISFKFAKPKLWGELKMKLDEGTLEICNSTKKGKYLIGNENIGYFELSEQGIIKAISSKGNKATKKKSEKSKDHKENEQAKQGENNSNYFDGKSQKIFEGNTGKAESNSKFSDRILSEINEQNKSAKLEELRKEITEQYEESTGEKLELTDEQLLSILDAHEQDGKLGELTLGQLKVKVKTLSEAITNEKVIRFLLEAGFCGQEGINDNYKQYINELGKNLNLSKGDIENIEESIELINKNPIENGIRLGELPITEILYNNYKGIKDLVYFIPDPYKISYFFREYLTLPNERLEYLKLEKKKNLQEILSNFSEDIKNKCKNAGIDIDERLRILKGEISLEEAKQICTDEKIIKLAQNKEGIINKHALEVAIKLKNWKISTSDIGDIFELGNNEYMKIKELIEYLEKDLSDANLSINNIGQIIQVGEYKKTYTDPFERNFYENLSHGEYRFEYLLEFYLIDGRRLTNLHKTLDIKHNLSISLMTSDLILKHRDYKGERRKILASLIYHTAHDYISKEEKQALGDYKGVGYEGINKTANDPKNEISKIISQYLERMPLREDLEVERRDPINGIAEKIKLSFNGETKTLSEILKTGGKCDENNLEQSSFIRDSFISTTVYKYQQAPIVRHFTVKKGVGATYLDVLGFNSEGEILLDKNCKITITKLEASGGGAQIYATVEKQSEQGKKDIYFDGKSQKIFKGDTKKAEANSKTSDRILSEINEQNKSQKLQELREEINKQYTQATGEELNLTDEQLLSILDAHEQDGKLGELKIGELKVKVKTLSEAITNEKVIRFLLEAGFCGSIFPTKRLKISENKEIMKNNEDRLIKSSDMKNYDFYFRAGNTDFVIRETGNNFYGIKNINNNTRYELGPGEYIIGREGNIPIYNDTYASRQHLKLKIDKNGNITIRDISNNGTTYIFRQKQVLIANNPQNNDRYIEIGYQIGQEVNIPMNNGRAIEGNEVIEVELDPEYQIGQEVNIPRSDGRITKAKITTYDPSTRMFRVVWEENGLGKQKYLSQEALDKVNYEAELKSEHQKGKETNMPMNNGRPIEGNEVIEVELDSEYQIEQEINIPRSDGRAIEGNEVIPGIYSNRVERVDRGTNTERREIADVQRNSDVIAIGDLHGEYVALKGNMEFSGLAKEVNGHLEWTGGNKKVVFQGDILGDRGTDSFRIIKEIHQLREQARQQGGDIDIIVGNHDDFLITYLLGGEVSRFAPQGEKRSALSIATHSNQGLGLTELAKFIGRKVGDFMSLGGRGTRQQILQKMRESPEGRMILEEICNMKLVSQVDDVLYCHTNPTSRMLRYLTHGNIQTNINLLNQKYQGYLRKRLLGGGNQAITTEEFNEISDIFLDTGNRDISGIENYVELLRNSGINTISHGHSGGGGTKNGRNIYQNGVVNINGLRIVDTDYSYGKRGRTSERQHSVSVIKKEGGVNYLGDNVAHQFEIAQDSFSLTDYEIETINNESLNNATKENVIKIVRELGRRIIKGENPTNELLINICSHYNQESAHWYSIVIKNILKKLPDRKLFIRKFESNNNSNINNQEVTEFRNKRGQKGAQQQTVQQQTNTYQESFNKNHETYLESKNTPTEIPKGSKENFPEPNSGTEIDSKSLLTTENNIIDQMETDTKTRKIIKDIINELRKRICKGEEPNHSLYSEILGNHPVEITFKTTDILSNLPDRKDFYNLFFKDHPTTNNYVENFRKKWKQIYQTPEPPKEKPNRKKVKAQYEAIERPISNYEGYIKIAEDIESDVPLLSNEDISFGFMKSKDIADVELTDREKVVSIDPRSLTLSLLGSRTLESPSQEVVFYDKKNDISHIVHRDQWAKHTPILTIAIKGKVSQKDANALIKYLKEKNLFNVNPLYRNVTGIGGENILNRSSRKEIMIENFKKGVTEFFNER